MISEIFLVILILTCLLFSILIVQTLRFTSRQPSLNAVPGITIDTSTAAHHLAKALTYETVSYQDTSLWQGREFTHLHSYLEKTFPAVHSHLTREIVGNYSLLYTWKGSDERLAPILLMAHLDVVPVEEGTEENWIHPPFQGTITDGFIWGRGSMDIKEGVIGLLEAVELLLKEGFQPERTIYLAFGHDEEIGGQLGAHAIAGLISERSDSLEYVLDEGGSITQGIVPGVGSPVALVGIAEKGYVSLELSVELEGGHSAMPPRETTIGILSGAVVRLGQNQMPASFSGVVNHLFKFVGPEMDFLKRLIFANAWLFSPLIMNRLSRSPYTNSMIRTTTAPTIIEGGTKENVLPQKAKAIVNFRILPGDTVESVRNHVTTVIDDPRVTVKPVRESWDPSIVSDVRGKWFGILHHTIRQVFPDAVVAPFLVTGATDSRHYAGLSENVFKFIPFITTSEDLKRVHGTDERISIHDFEYCIRFYVQLIRNSAT